MSQKLDRKSILSIYLISFAGQIAWAVENQYYNVFLYNEIAPVPIYVSLMVAITAVISTVTAIIMGAYSDVKGKRRRFMIFGFIFWTITTSLFPFAALVKPVIMAVMVAILFDSIMTYFGATAYDATFNAHVTDITTLQNRGKAVGIMEIMTLVAVLLIYGGSGYIIQDLGYLFFFFIVGFLVGIFGITGTILAKDSEKLQPLNSTILNQLKILFNPQIVRKNKDFFLVLTGAMIWEIGFNVFFPLILIYLNHNIGLSLELASLVVFFALLVSIILGIPIGMIIDKVGRKNIAMISVFFEFISLILFAFFQDVLFLIILGISWVLFLTIFRISSKTWIKDLYQEEKYGQFSGYFILFTVLIAMTIGPLIGGMISTMYGEPIVIDGIPGNIPPSSIFIVGAFIMLISIIPILRAREKKAKISIGEEKIIKSEN